MIVCHQAQGLLRRLHSKQIVGVVEAGLDILAKDTIHFLCPLLMLLIMQVGFLGRVQHLSYHMAGGEKIVVKKFAHPE